MKSKSFGLVAMVLACACGGGDYDGGGGLSAYPGSGNAGPRGVPRVAPGTPDSEDGPDPLAVPEGSYWLQISGDDSTSMASAQLARLGVTEGLHPHEVVNYYDPPAALFGAEPWAQSHAPTANTELGTKLVMREPEEDGTLRADLLVQLRAAPVSPETRRPWHLVYCVDVSGSMEGEKLGFVKQALLASLEHLREGDHVSIVTFSDEAYERTEHAAWPADQADIRHIFGGLATIGGTNMIAGLDTAYRFGEAHLDPNVLTRVLLFGDGAANIGELDIARFADLTRVGNQEGVYLSSVGVGYDFDWARMDALADAGKGASIFLPDAQEVTEMFGASFYKLVEVAADDVTIELVLPDSMELVAFSGEETSTDPNARVPSFILASGDDMTMLAAFELNEAALAEPLTLRVSMRPLATGELVTYESTFATVGAMVRAPGDLYARTRIVNAYARHVAQREGVLAEILADIDAYPRGDEGLTRIRALLAP